MVQLLYLLLYPRQIGSLPYIQRGFPPFEGLSGFVKKSSPVWAFSLNHDLMSRLLARHCGIPLRDGFWPDKLLTIGSNRPGAGNVSLQAEILPENYLNRGDLHLFRNGEFGINLIRLHGALDIFAFRDGLDLCRLLPIDSQPGRELTALRLVNEEIGYWDRSGKAHVLNEIAYTDESGQMQFLRRSLLAGLRNLTSDSAKPHLRRCSTFFGHISTTFRDFTWLAILLGTPILIWCSETGWSSPGPGP